MNSRIYEWGTFTSFANLVAVAVTTYDGDVAQVVMGGRSTNWKYDATITTWRIDDTFVTTYAVIVPNVGPNVALPGVQGGDKAFCTDTGQTGTWDAINLIWTF